jgi:hypothetical protein
MLVSQPHFAAEVFEPSTMLTLHGRPAPSDADLAVVIPAMVKLVSENELARSLVITDGGAPSTAQRKRLFDAIGGRSDRVRNAVVSDAASVRFVISAMSLVVDGIRAFSPDEINSALAYLEYSPREIVACASKLRTIAKSLPAGRFLTFERALDHLSPAR